MFAKYRAAKNLELKRKSRNIATRERRKAIRAYWYKKTKDQDNRINSTTPFYLETKEQNVVKDQKEVAEALATYFTDVAFRRRQDLACA